MTTPDISDWLRQHGFADLAPLFLQHKVDLQVLPLLTGAHLREMGVPLGSRLKLMAAIPGLPATSTTTDVVERRHLTVVFVDLVGSTPLSIQLDPEELRELLRAFHSTVNAEVSRLDGYVAQYKGDGALVYFGYPQAHEDDPQRAVMAAMAIMRRLTALPLRTGQPVAAHVGIATGLAVVGDTFGQSAARERSAIGETPNLAARLSDLATSGEILVSAKTARITQHQFEFEALAPRVLKGIDEPVQAYRVIRERENDSLFDARRGPVRGAIVGREVELAALLKSWEAVEDGQGGRAIVVSGEAGIGKSRLLRALGDSLIVRSHLRITNQCSPYHARTALFPIRQQIAHAAGFRPGDTAEDRLAKLASLLKGADAHEIALTAAMLDMDVPTPGMPATMTPGEQRQRTFDALFAHLQRAAQRNPILWLLEDAHWIDPTSLDFLVQFLKRIAGTRVLVLITCRPEFDLPLPDSVGHIHLSRLGVEAVGAMIRALCGGRPVAEIIVDRVADRTDGVPLYVEELFRTLVEGGMVVEHGGGLIASSTIDERSIPTTLHDSLMARLDHHRAHKEVAQVASVIGREFDIDLLSRVSGLPPNLLEPSLRELQDAEILHAAAHAVPGVYFFKHALVRDAAYESLLIRRRESLHASILDALQADPDASAELLARHASAASLPVRAIECWMRAAGDALTRAAFAEAVAHLTNALESNERIGDTATIRQQRVDLLLALGQAIMPLRGYSHSETVRVFDRADLLAEGLADDQRTFWANYARWVIYYVRGEHLTAHRIACLMVARAETAASPGRALAGLRSRGISEMILGQPAEARLSFEESASRAKDLKGRPSDRRMAVAQRFAADPEIATQFHVALTLWSLGHIEDALGIAERAVRDARALGHVHTLGHALVHGAIVAVVDRNPTLALPLCVEAADFAERHDMDLWRGYAQILRGHALALAGQVETGVEALIAGLDRMHRMETGTMVPLHDAVCAWGLAALGRHDDARPYAERVALELTQGCERYFWPDMLIWRARQLALTSGDNNAAAEAALRQGLDEATAQGACAMALKVATALATCLLRSGRMGEAGSLLDHAISGMPAPSRAAVWMEAIALRESIRQQAPR